MTPSREHATVLRVGTIGSVAIAMAALFVLGRSLGAERELHLPALTVALIASMAAFALPALVGLLPANALSRSRLGAQPYSEASLLQRWPRGRDERARFDRADIEG